jgi:hypothetical protein
MAYWKTVMPKNELYDALSSAGLDMHQPSILDQQIFLPMYDFLTTWKLCSGKLVIFNYNCIPLKLCPLAFKQVEC